MELPAEYDKLTWDERTEARNQYIQEQQNKCWYCNGSLYQKPPDDVLKFKVNPRWFPEGFLTILFTCNMTTTPD